MKNKKMRKVSGGNKREDIDIVKRTQSKVADKNGAEISASLTNLKIGGNLQMANLDKRQISESTKVVSSERVTEVTAGIGRGN
jgi:hypothetical protein